MTRYLAGIHDREGARHVPAGGWCLDTIALNDRPHAFDYAREQGVEWIVRMNHGYGSTGTIPRPARYAEFADLCAQYVLQSRGVSRWIIGNEPNHSVERPDGQPITPENYAVCFNLCRQAIQAVRPLAEVIPAPVAPWNVESGDWLDYWQTVLAGINGCEGLAVHSYIHEADPNLVNSDGKMDAPFQDRHFQFAAYRDALARVPDRLRHLPVYLTEANPLSGWQARGIIPAMLDHVHAWNLQPATQRIQCVIFYRYPPFDRWSMSDKADVMAEFRQHAQRRPSPEPRRIDEPTKPPVTPPTPPQPAPLLPVRLIDESFFQRVPGVKLSDGTPGRTHYRLVRAEYVPDAARRFGPDHHILVDVLDRDGNRKLQTPVAFWWADGQEIRSTDKPREPYAVDYAMYAAGHSYGVRVAEREATSDEAFGMGLGKLGNDRQSDHVSYFLIFRETMPVVPLVPRPQPGESGQTLYVNAPGEGLKIRSGPGLSYAQVGGLEHGASVTVYEITPTEPYWARIDTGWVARWLLAHTKPAPVQPASKVPRLTHPVQNPQYRRITQVFGVNPERYAQFGLRGHNGVDYGVPVGQLICAADVGVVAEVANDERGFGKYVKLRHAWGESLYAHLSVFLVVVGMVVDAGQAIGQSGNTGNSTGPHLHLGIRVTPYDRTDGWSGYSDPLPYLDDAGDSPVEPMPPASIVNVVREAAREYGVDENLMLALIWKESSYNPNAVNQASGAKGLGQVMPLTWGEWSAKTGATNIFDARDNARVSSAYLNWCIRTAGSERRGLWSYVWGIGRVLDLGKPGQPTQPPAEVIEYANAIIYGRDLLDAVLP